MSFFSRTLSALGAGLVALTISTGAQAAVTNYYLFDHPSRGVSSQEYGLRMDSLGLFFSFEDTSGNSLAKLSVDVGAGTASVTGQMRESNGADSALWNLTMTMTGVTDFSPNGWAATDYTAALTSTSGSTAYSASAVSALGSIEGKKRDGYEFIFGESNIPDINGETFRDVPTAAGWVVGGGTNDFLATFAPVPLPAPIALGLFALGGLGAYRARQKQLRAA